MISPVWIQAHVHGSSASKSVRTWNIPPSQKTKTHDQRGKRIETHSNPAYCHSTPCSALVTQSNNVQVMNYVMTRLSELHYRVTASLRTTDTVIIQTGETAFSETVTLPGSPQAAVTQTSDFVSGLFFINNREILVIEIRKQWHVRPRVGTVVIELENVQAAWRKWNVDFYWKEKDWAELDGHMSHSFSIHSGDVPNWTSSTSSLLATPK